MARIRSVKPEIRRSLTVAEWPHSVRLAWIYLWMYLDDAGRGLDDMRLIVAELFPLDRDVSENKMNRWLGLMATTKTAEDDVPPLCRYEVQGRRYLHATGWQHQKINRPQPSRLPPCPIHDSLTESRSEPATESAVNDALSDSLLDSPPSRAPADQGSGSMDQGSMDQGVREAHSSAKPSAPDLFDEFWSAYPKKVAKLAAKKRWDALVKRGTDPLEIIAGAVAYAREKRETDPQYVKQPDGWLSAGRWQDEPMQPAGRLGGGVDPVTSKPKSAGWEFGMDR